MEVNLFTTFTTSLPFASLPSFHHFITLEPVYQREQGPLTLSNMAFETLFTRKNQSAWSGREHWTELCHLHISDEKAKQENESKRSPSNGKDRLRTGLVEDGYVLVDDVVEEQLTSNLKDAIISLHARGYPATFVLLYDETWELARLALKTLSVATHPSNIFNFDILAWHIDPRENVAGFSPHRDRQPIDVKSSFHEDQQAKYVTMWMALTDATPENSCLYVIPKQSDPGYTDGDSDSGTDLTDQRDDPLWRALSNKESFQNIRALPRQAGQSVIFTHRILHWGSRGNPNSLQHEPRVAISFVCSDPTFERPYLNSSHFPPNFTTRLLLVCAQLLMYYQRLDLPKECIRACYEYCKDHAAELDTAYRNKVTVEFVKAMKEATDSNSNGDLQDTDENDDGDDALLEAMLDAEEGGYGDFEDEFDELEESSPRCFVDHDESQEDDDHAAVSLFGKRPHDKRGEDEAAKKMKAKEAS